MSTPPVSVRSAGLVTSVGLTAAASCAAFRAKISNPRETHFIDSDGQWIMAHQVLLEQPLRGLGKLVRMATLAIEEALSDVPRATWSSLPLLLCVAEPGRPGRLDGLDAKFFQMLEAELGVRFSEWSAVVAQGRVATATAMHGARGLLAQKDVEHVLIVGADSLLNWSTLSHFERGGRLLTSRNSNGFIPGEAAGAVLVQKGSASGGLQCTGLGFAREAASIDTEAPLRGDGLAHAVRVALAQSGLGLHEVDYRIADLSGEHYYFKEAALALQRNLRQRRSELDLWHPAECTGEIGAASGASMLALAKVAAEKGFAAGPRVLVHLSNDDGERGALLLEYAEA